MKNYTLIGLLTLLISIAFISCTDPCDDYPDEAFILPEVYEWLPDAATFPSIFTSNQGNVRSLTFSSELSNPNRYDCATKTYESYQFNINLDDTDRIRFNANIANFTIAALLGETDSYTYSGQWFTNDRTVHNGQTVDTAIINNTTYTDLFLVTSNDETLNLDSIYVQNGTEFMSFKYKDEIWVNDL